MSRMHVCTPPTMSLLLWTTGTPSKRCNIGWKGTTKLYSIEAKRDSTAFHRLWYKIMTVALRFVILNKVSAELQSLAKKTIRANISKLAVVACQEDGLKNCSRHTSVDRVTYLNAFVSQILVEISWPCRYTIYQMPVVQMRRRKWLTWRIVDEIKRLQHTPRGPRKGSLPPMSGAKFVISPLVTTAFFTREPSLPQCSLRGHLTTGETATRFTKLPTRESVRDLKRITLPNANLLLLWRSQNSLLSP